MAFFPESLMQRICACTSPRLLARGCEELTLPELMEWLAISISMGVVQQPSTKDYWATTHPGKIGPTRVSAHT
jgi:hypothetical protein